MSLRHLLFLVLMGLILCGSARAQDPSAPDDGRFLITGVGRLNVVVGVPTGTFREKIDGLGYGGTLFGGLRFGDAPFVLGLDLGFLVYGRTVDTVPFSRTVGSRVTVEVVTTNSILEPHLVLRVQPSGGRVRPYLDGLFGVKYLVTTTSVHDEDRSDEESPIASTTNFSDVTVSGGVGTGVDILVYRGPPTEDVHAVSVHLGVQYLVGGQAEYLAEGALRDTNGNGQLDNEELDFRRSTTTLVQPQLGVTLRF